MVPGARIELAQGRPYRILSPARLPISPPRPGRIVQNAGREYRKAEGVWEDGMAYLSSTTRKVYPKGVKSLRPSRKAVSALGYCPDTTR
jgi:hypothetical protein